jgi:hypothetical protein
MLPHAPGVQVCFLFTISPPSLLSSFPFLKRPYDIQHNDLMEQHIFYRFIDHRGRCRKGIAIYNVISQFLTKYQFH